MRIKMSKKEITDNKNGIINKIDIKNHQIRKKMLTIMFREKESLINKEKCFKNTNCNRNKKDKS